MLEPQPALPLGKGCWQGLSKEWGQEGLLDHSKGSCGAEIVSALLVRQLFLTKSALAKHASVGDCVMVSGVTVPLNDPTDKWLPPSEVVKPLLRCCSLPLSWDQLPMRLRRLHACPTVCSIFLLMQLKIRLLQPRHWSACCIVQVRASLLLLCLPVALSSTQPPHCRPCFKQHLRLNTNCLTATGLEPPAVQRLLHKAAPKIMEVC